MVLTHLSFCSFSNTGCECKDGYSGPFCEYEEYKEPECSLECRNGGRCAKGNKYIANLTLQDPDLEFLHDFDMDNFEHCICASGYAGAECQIQVEICGEDNHICLHGSKCLKHEDGEYRCDCEKAFTADSRFAGTFCQHHHTDICTPTGQLQFTGGAADHAFCVNDGVCQRSENSVDR